MYLTKVHTSLVAPLLLLVSALLLPMTVNAQRIPERQADSTAEAENRGTATPAIPPPLPNQSFVIGPDDVLAINVWKEPEISRSVTVRSDGKISLALVGELQASGKTPQQMQTEITQKLAPFINNPTVTVITQEIKSRRISVLGKVSNPGTFPLTGSVTVLEAIALAGGLRDFAKQNSIYILRYGPDGSQQRLPFNYKEVLKGNNQSQNILLEPHDTVVVP